MLRAAHATAVRCNAAVQDVWYKCDSFFLFLFVGIPVPGPGDICMLCSKRFAVGGWYCVVVAVVH